jgi:hypothetical protein
VMIGNRGLDFELDSGDSQGISIDAEVAKELGLKTFATHSEVAGGRFNSSLVVVPGMKVGDVTMQNVSAHTLPFGWDYGRVSRTELVGLLGYDFIRSLGITIDYTKHRLTAFPAESYVPPTMTPSSDILPIRLGNHVPEIAAVINGNVAEHVVVDTGARGAQFILFDYFAMRYPEAFAPNVARLLGGLPYVPKGIGGGFKAEPYELKEVDIGRYHFYKYDALKVVSEQRFQFQEDGLIGSDILKHFTVGFDYAGGKMYLVHNPGQ